MNEWFKKRKVDCPNVDTTILYPINDVIKIDLCK